MPGGDRTGPTGMGPMTGRGVGYCSGYDAPGYANPMPGRGFGMGGGRGRGAWGGGFGWGGRGRRNRFYAGGFTGRPFYGVYQADYRQPEPVSERKELKQEAAALKARLDAINKRLEQLASTETD